MAAEGIPLGQWSGSDATNALRESIERFNAKTAKQTAWLLCLTWVIAALTLVMAIGVAVQMYIATSAHANFAWVLWLAQNPPARGDIPPSAWTPLEGHETKNACEQAMNRIGGLAKGDSYMCLPDTVDPRGLKGE